MKIVNGIPGGMLVIFQILIKKGFKKREGVWIVIFVSSPAHPHP